MLNQEQHGPFVRLLDSLYTSRPQRRSRPRGRRAIESLENRQLLTSLTGVACEISLAANTAEPDVTDTDVQVCDEQFDAVEEAIVIGQDTGDGDQRVVLFLRLGSDQELTEDLVARIRSEIRANATPRHVPSVILAVEDIPRTRSGKISEIAVRDVVHGRKIKNTEALANPEALEFFRDRL